ncbi:aminoglycoside adenylyltransferase domain-containing protein [Paenibacillus alvei]|uniref:aminoglycoside adenylyltransferase domain-containing protein n=1 Tax=Paenibacillus alvei TaxID=44250 RepID=UPI0022815F46|nr:aminoglycoside adenylyltransferase domain-containing protein [Paenibacillus alvei]MCY7483233.1 DUF4111 domain-containing protein [Paenibacillus alvei]
MNQQSVLDGITNLLKCELSQSLVGIYLHGSMAMGCFTPQQSDIDLLVIVKEKLPKIIAREIIRLEEELKLVRGFEISIVLETYAVGFVHSTPFEFHYSSFHKERYRTDEDYFCGGYADPDLAAHFVVTYNRGVVLFGKEIKEVFKPIKNEYYMDSIMADVNGAFEEIAENPVYYVSNLSRVLLYVRESVISSKKEAGEWALDHLPNDYHSLIAQCLAKYRNELEI